ncbi:MAG: 2-phospho-L-lactate transferase CofD family protein [Candidatus Heimdallarchaeota archaeon]|nr:2-phospho-L-lactate transferase CofD family protein [Candidatus Heimdallarchaeota archaeon]
MFRTNLLKINTLTEITKMICNQWQISATILPMADQLITTLLDTQHGKLHFQEYFVRHRHSIDVHKIIFQGDKTQSTKDVLMAISNAKQIIIGPSNPVTSIGPIISINDVNQQLKDTSHKVTLISPIEGNRAFSGPTVQLMLAHGISPDIIGICNYYQNLISKIIISPKDKHLSSKIYDLGIEPMIMDIELKNDQNKSQLAREILDVL